MTEKEFLESYTEAYLNDYPGPAEKTIEKFLEAFHSEYNEVEFKRKPFDEIAKEQIEKMRPELHRLLNRN